ncbi:BnaCnng39080D [Brassica napus]|uniref:BnaCnng39080D protein n=1 Tax=Brassica napus TaxID=3708 RepID=A0A078J6E3_BRANA|nr:BnaCnng39080D [Brassica napus]
MRGERRGGPLSPCGSSRIERFDDVSRRWLSSMVTGLSVLCSPRFVQAKLMFNMLGSNGVRYTSCGNRAEEALSNNGLQYQNRKCNELN